jgi:RNA polymerase sigma-70 factor (ECF subfamily)
VPSAALAEHGSGESAEAIASLIDPQPIAVDALVQMESATRLHAALDDLPEMHQSVVLLRFYEGATLAEIAVAMDVPMGTVKSRLHYALARLREMPEVVNLWSQGEDI